MVSIMPGIESRAPERTDTSSGMAALSPNFVPMIFSMKAMPALTCGSSDFGIGSLVGVIIGADFGGDGESGRHRQADAAHLGQVRAFAAEQRFHAAVAVGFLITKQINVFCGFRCFSHKSNIQF